MTNYNISSSALSSPISSPTLPPLSPPPVTLSFQLPSLALLGHNPRLPNTIAYVFTHYLFSRTLLDTTPATIRIRCMQPTCHYTPANWTLHAQSTRNLIRHYDAHYPEIPTSMRKAN
jgi:hypothetical protein